MKKILTIVLLVLTGIAAATADDFDKKMKLYGNTHGITTVIISKAMLSMAAGMDINAAGIDLKSASDKIDNISIATSDNRLAAKNLRIDAANLFLSSKKYSLLMKVQDNGETTTILSRKTGKDKMEYVVLSDEPGEYSIIVIRGSMTPQDISKMLNKK